MWIDEGSDSLGGGMEGVWDGWVLGCGSMEGEMNGWVEGQREVWMDW